MIRIAVEVCEQVLVTRGPTVGRDDDDVGAGEIVGPIDGRDQRGTCAEIRDLVLFVEIRVAEIPFADDAFEAIGTAQELALAVAAPRIA